MLHFNTSCQKVLRKGWRVVQEREDSKWTKCVGCMGRWEGPEMMTNMVHKCLFSSRSACTLSRVSGIHLERMGGGRTGSQGGKTGLYPLSWPYMISSIVKGLASLTS